MKTLFPLLISICAAVHTAWADWSIHTEFYVVTLAKKQAAALMPELRDDAKIEAAFAKLESLVTAGEAHTVATLTGRCDAGGKLESKQVDEVRYASEWEPAKPVGDGKVPAVALNPSTFDVREVGVRFSAETEVSTDGQTLRLKTEESHVRLIGWSEVEAARLPDDSKVTLKQPQFSISRHAGSISLKSGKRTLLGVHAVPGKPDEVELFILRGWTTPTAK